VFVQYYTPFLTKDGLKLFRKVILAARLNYLFKLITMDFDRNSRTESTLSKPIP